MLVNPPIVEFLRTKSKFRKREEISSSLQSCISSVKCKIRHFHDEVVHAVTAKKYTKKRNARAKLLFWSLNLLLF